MEDEVKKKIEELMETLQCSKDFICYKSGFKTLCKAKDHGLPGYLDCLEESPNCTFALPFGKGHFCKCPIRIYIIKELGK